MLRKIDHERPATHVRSLWFCNDFFDLIVWIDPEENIAGFQLCYEKEQDERALTWTPEHGFTHRKVDLGAHLKNQTPILVPDGVFAKDRIIDRFREKGQNIAPPIYAFVLGKLGEVPPEMCCD